MMAQSAESFIIVSGSPDEGDQIIKHVAGLAKLGKIFQVRPFEPGSPDPRDEAVRNSIITDICAEPGIVEELHLSRTMRETDDGENLAGLMKEPNSVKQFGLFPVLIQDIPIGVNDTLGEGYL